MGLEAVPMAVFAKGAWYALEDLCASGYNVVSLDWLHDPAEAMAVANGRVTIQGNADPGVLYGGRAAIQEAVKAMIEGFGNGQQGWIANLGHGEFASGYLVQTPGMLTLYVNRNHAVCQTRGPGVLPERDP